MLDPAARRLIDGPLDQLGATIARYGIGANAVTVAGFVAGLAAMAALAFQAYGVAVGLVVVNRVLDGVDGVVARRTGATDLGGYLDIVFDFLIYSGIVFAFAVGRPEHALAAAFLIFSFVGTGSSFLAFAIFATKRGLSTERSGSKSLYYLGGLAEGTETILVLLAMCLFPQAFEWIAYGFGAVCWLTTAGRILAAYHAFSAAPGGPGQPAKRDQAAPISDRNPQR